MNMTRPIIAAALATLALGLASPARAGWDGVFQVTCWHRCCPSTSGFLSQSFFADPCCNPCPQQVCTTRYVQRSYYQACTTYQARSFTEAVTSYRTSYFYAPVTTVRYSCCYDPCTCTSRMVATPITRWELRSQCCPVTNYVQRCCYVPVTSYQKVCYWEPQTCCSLVDPCTGGVISNGTAAPGLNGQVPAVPAETPQPGVSEFRNGGSTGSPLYNKTYPPNLPEGSGSSYRSRSQRPPTIAAPPTTTVPQAPVIPKMDRIALDDSSASSSGLVGRVLAGGAKSPRASTQLVFVPNAASGKQETVMTDADGRFRVKLDAGDWSVYLRDAGGNAVLHSTVSIGRNELRQMTLVSR